MDFRKTISNKITGPLVPALNKIGLTPNIITWSALIINILAAAAAATNYLLACGILVLFAGLFDILDGALARFANKSTRFGALLDSTFDRFSEAIVLFGLLYLYVNAGKTMEILLIFIVMIFSFLISYIRARSEGLNIDNKTGLFTRTERVIILALGLIVNQVLITLVILAIFTFITVIQRLIYAYIQTQKTGQA
jgi:CDP-diacylglycerol---glycerol-3-phosphate 3-phosphatidyltransferase